MSAKRHSRLTILLAVALIATFALSVFAQGEEAMNKGRQAFKKRQYQEAVRQFKIVTNEYPDWSYGHFFLGLSYKYVGDYNNAIRSLKRALELAANENELFGASTELADSYYRKGDYRNAVKYVLEARKRKGANKYNANAANLRLIEGISRYHLKQYQQAINLFQPDLRSGKASANILRTVAKCYQELNQNSKAVEVIQLAVQKDPEDLAAHLILVKSHLNDSKWKKALDAANYAIQFHGGNWELLYLKGRALYKLRQYAQAAQALRDSLAIRHQDKTSKLLGDVYRDSEEYLKATDAYNTAQRSYAKDPTFFTSFAFSWYMYVPKNAEKFHGTPDEKKYTLALENAQVLLDAAKKLAGADRVQIKGIEDGIKNKLERLAKGETITEEYEIFIDPETGKVEKRKIKKDGEQ